LGAAPLSFGKMYLLRSWTLSRCFDSSARTLGPYWIMRRLLFVFGVVMP
jgi:hypothetical protein